MQLTNEPINEFYTRLLEILYTANPPYNLYVSRLNVLLHAIFDKASKNDKVSFRNSYHKYIHIQNKYDLPDNLIKEMHGFRKLTMSVLNAKHIETSEEKILLSISVVAQCVFSVSYTHLTLPTILLV